MRARATLLLAALVATGLVTVGQTGVARADVSHWDIKQLVKPSYEQPQGFTSPGSGATFPNTVGEQFSSPLVVDLYGDGVLESVAGFLDGTVAITKLTGPNAGTLARTPWQLDGAVQSSPTIITVSGKPDILVGTTGWCTNKVSLNQCDSGSEHGGSIYVLDPRTGAVVLRFNPHTALGNNFLPGFFASPVAADIDGNGQPEIIANSWDEYLYVIRLDGSVVWRAFQQDTAWSSPAVADINGDGKLEVVAGYDCDGVPGQDCYPNYGGYLAAYSSTGSRLWRRFIPQQVVWSSPAVTVSNGRPMIFVGTGNMNSMTVGQHNTSTTGRYLYGFDGTGAPLPGWPVALGGRTTSSPVIGQVFPGETDVVVAADNGTVYAIRASDGAIRMNACFANQLATQGAPCYSSSAHPTASLADVDGDGLQDVVIGGEQWMNVIGAIDPSHWDYKYAGESKPGYGTCGSQACTATPGTNPMVAAPAVVNVGGRATIVASTSYGNGVTGSGYVHETFLWQVTDRSMGFAEWPHWRGNDGHAGTPMLRIPSAPSISSGSASGFSATAPCRLFRVSLGAGQAVTVNSRQTCSGHASPVPAGATAVLLTVTGSLPTTNTDIRVYPAKGAPPYTSVVNAIPGANTPNLVVADLAADGTFQVWNHSGSTTVIGDLYGYFAPGSGSLFQPRTPTRIVRLDNPQATYVPVHGPQLQPNQAFSFVVPNVPSGATAVVMNLTGFKGSANNDVRIYPGSGTTGYVTNPSGVPYVSSLNLLPNETRADLVTVPLGPNNTVTVYSHSAAVSVALDLAGFYVAGSGSSFVPTTPVRVLDTSSGLGVSPQPTQPVVIGSGGQLNLHVSGLPAGTTAVALNLLGANPSAGTDLRAWPAGVGKPGTSNVNLYPNENRPNLVVVPVGTNGNVSIANSSGYIRVIADLYGYYK